MLSGSRTVARVLARQWSDIGTLADGTQTVSDVKDLLANWDPRLAQLNAQAAGLDPDILGDLAGLNSRYNNAAAPARAAINDTSWNPIPADARPMQGAYDAILGALKQVPGTVTKGDFDDLAQRVTEARAAVGQSTGFSTTQPTTQDQGMGLYKALAPFDVLAWATGQQATIWPFSPAPADKPDPLHTLEGLIVLATIGFGGMFAVRLVVMPALKTAMWLAGTLTGGWLAYKGTKATGETLGQAEQTAGKFLGL